MFIDTHTHLYLQQFKEDIDQVIDEAISNKVNAMYLPHIDSKTTEDLLQLEARYPEHCFAMMGLHPCSVKDSYKDEMQHIKDQLGKRPFCAIGEIGIDLYWDKTFKKEQISVFQEQIEMAKNLNIPFVIHSRDSLDLTIDIVSDLQDGSLTGIFHCFNGNKDQAKAIMDINFHMGLGGVITFKKAALDDVVDYISNDYMVLETDAPYLSPTPHRGKRNESSYIPIIAKKVADVKNISIEEVAKFTSQNSNNIFKKDKPI